MDTPFVFFAMVVLVFGAAAWLAWHRHQQKLRRREALQLLALTHGLTYSRVDPLGLEALPFAFLRRGDDRGIENVVHGTIDGRAVALFDLWVMHESTDSKGNRSRRYEHHTCATTTVPDAWWPAMTMKPETVLSRLGDTIGLRDLQFESDEFNRAWNVTCDDRRFAYAFVDARMMRWLLMVGDDHRFDVSGPHLLVATDQLDVDAWPVLARVLDQFVDRIPAVARELYPVD